MILLITFNILNIISMNLTAKIWFVVSAIFSISYFIMSLGEIVHIFWNHYHPNYDWEAQYRIKRKSKFHCPGDLGLWVIADIIIVLLLVIIFPILHI